MSTKIRTITRSIIILIALGSIAGCEAQQRRVELPTASGADETLDDRFGLTSDAQDPSQRDKELGYGRWKAKPEPKGTDSPTSPDRRGSWTGSP